MTSIIGYLDTLLESDIEDQDTRERFLQIIKEETDRLSNLINDLLNLSKIESQIFKLEADNFEKIVKKVVNLLSQKAKNKSLSLT